MERRDDDRVAVGRANERRAERALTQRGYRIVERNFRGRIGELDLIAYDGDVLVFIEVRSRRDGDHGGGLAALTPAKLRQVARVAELYLTLRRPRYATCRFDLVAITGDDLTIIRDAFRITW